MKDKVVKLGVVGLCRGRNVVSEIIGEKGVKLTAICDHNPKTLENAVVHFRKMNVTDLQIYDKFEDILKSDIDAIFIATDAIYHVPYVIQALDAGKHVISEIPAVNSLEEAKMLKAAVTAHPELKYMTAENCCYWAFIQAWKQMYEDGKFGETVYAESEYLHAKDYRDYVPLPEGHWRSFNPAIKYLTHNLGPLLYIMDDKCVSVTCMEPDIQYNPYRKGPANGVALFRTAKGAVIRILICFGAYVGFDHNFRLIGTRGSIETDMVKPLGEAHSFARLSEVPGTLDDKIDIPVTLSFPGEQNGGHGGADKKMMMDFIKCIIEDTNPPIDVDFGIRMSLPGIFAHESAVNGGVPIEIPEIE
ncbi:MAG: Gfo/Idh/MocA family oxidoreductase [Lachnospiraceae bacterium]|nr:Gfo/Idh/MocA family oxidoreductase [Lachnospiraceae bacterium]